MRDNQACVEKEDSNEEPHDLVIGGYLVVSQRLLDVGEGPDVEHTAQNTTHSTDDQVPIIIVDSCNDTTYDYQTEDKDVQRLSATMLEPVGLSLQSLLDFNALNQEAPAELPEKHR